MTTKIVEVEGIGSANATKVVVGVTSIIGVTH